MAVGDRKEKMNFKRIGVVLVAVVSAAVCLVSCIGLGFFALASIWGPVLSRSFEGVFVTFPYFLQWSILVLAALGAYTIMRFTWKFFVSAIEEFGIT